MKNPALEQQPFRPALRGHFALAVFSLITPAVCHAGAQLPSARSLLNGPFDGAAPPGSARFVLLAPVRESMLGTKDRYPAIELRQFTEETARTTQGGVEVGSLTGGGSTMCLRLPGGRMSSSELVWDEYREDALLRNNSGRTTTAKSLERFWSIRHDMRFGRAGLYARYRSKASTLDVQTGEASGKGLPLNSDAGIALRGMETGAGLGLIYPLGANVQVEASADREEASGNMTLRYDSSGGTRTFVGPIGSSGWRWGAAIALRSGAATSLYGYFSRMQRLGSGSPQPGGDVASGEARTTYGSEEAGLTLRQRFGGKAAATLYWSSARTRFDTSAHGIDASAVGAAGTGLDRVGYSLATGWERREYGVRWEQRFADRHGLRIDYRWLEVPLRARYTYFGQSFVFALSSGGGIDYPDARGHLLRLAYDFPVGSISASLEVSQAIPMRIRSAGAGGGAGGSDAGGRRTTGGWSISIGMRRSR